MKKQPFFLLAHIGLETGLLAYLMARAIGKEIVVIDIDQAEKIKAVSEKAKEFIIKAPALVEELRTLSYKGKYSARTERRYKERKSKKQKIR